MTQGQSDDLEGPGILPGGPAPVPLRTAHEHAARTLLTYTAIARLGVMAKVLEPFDVEGGRRGTRAKSALAPEQELCALSYCLSLSVPLHTKKKGKGESSMKQILKEVSGAASPGDLLAIMGASGSGKTSTLNCLSQRNTSYTGPVLINGQQATRSSMARLSGFVQQEVCIPRTLCSIGPLQANS